MIKKCSLAVIGKVSAPASRIQDNASRTSALSSGELNQALSHAFKMHIATSHALHLR